MILLFVSNTYDSADKIIQWLHSMKKESVVRINYSNDTKIRYDFTYLKARIIIDNLEFDFDKIEAVYFNETDLHYKYTSLANRELNHLISLNLKNEMFSTFTHLFNQFPPKISIGISPFSNGKINKLNVLNYARLCDFKVPSTAIVSQKSDLIRYEKKWGKMITKNIDNGINIVTKSIQINGQKTEYLTPDFINSQNHSFKPSLIQKLVEKQFEVRIFYLNGHTYSIALFSQQDKAAEVDFRGQSPTNQIRMVPFQLPEIEKKKLTKLMQLLGLNIGSIDMIYTPEKEFVFLEVNPYGQYGFVSDIGNYRIEKIIAKELTHAH